MKKVSVIVPVYNSKDYLNECVESLVNQTLKDIEIIFINDGSTDESLEILEEYRVCYPDKIVVESKENGGQASARNLGIKLATGEYIGFLDSDDSADCDMFAKMYETAKKNGSDFVESAYEYLQVDSKGNKKELPSYGNVRAYKNIKEMFIDPLVSPWNKIYKRELLQENEILFPEGLIYEDTAFFIKAIPFIRRPIHLPEKLIHHYLWPNSTMNANKAKKVGNIFAVLQDILRFYDENNIREAYKDELEYFCVKILLCSSLRRIAQVYDKKMRKEFIQETKRMIRTCFPCYRKNKYFKHNKAGMYMRFMNGISIPFVVMLLRIKGMLK